MSCRVATVLLCAILTGAAFSQEFRAAISGAVSDPSGSVIAGAKITFTSAERNTSTEAASNQVGLYLVQYLLPGSYTVTVEKEGFKRLVRSGVTLNAADHRGMDLQLELGSLTDNINVTAEAPLLQTETASRSATIENRIIENVPANGRNLYQFQYTLPGVVKTSTYWGSMELYAFGNINAVSISGGVSGENETLIDGVTDTKGDRGVAYAPSLNGTQEFSIQTNTYDAQYGRVGGGVTNVTVKSGTNELHGQLFEFLKNDKLDANDWVANKEGDPRGKFQNNTYGFAAGGPVWIPKLFNGRNRVFFMLSLESLRENSSAGAPFTVPTAEQLNGDFSKTLNDNGDLVSIYDPLTTRLQADGTYVRTPFAGNKIPADRINAVAAAAASYYPKANLPGDGPAGQNNYFKRLPDHNEYDSWLGKMDFHISNKSNASFHYGQTPWIDFAGLQWANNAAEPSTEAPSTRVSRNFGADWTYTLSPRMVFNLRGGVARYEDFGGNTYGRNFDPTKLGFPASLVSQLTSEQFPYFSMGNFSQLGASFVTNYTTQDTYSIQPSMSYMRGRHWLKFGSEFRVYHTNHLQPLAASGEYDFDKNWTQAHPLQGDDTSGSEFASFLLGYPSGGHVDRNIDPAYKNSYYALYLQDDFKVSPTLTLNLGLRWDYEGPISERHNRQIVGFAFDQPSSIANQVQGLTLKGGVAYPGQEGFGSLPFQRDFNNFQPRLGVAWAFRPKWVLRGGFGLSYLGQSSTGQALGYSQPTSLIASTDGGITPAVSLSDPYPARLFPGGLLQATGSQQGLATNLGRSVTAPFRDRPLPYSMQYSFGFQRELPWGLLADVSYVGNQTEKRPVSLGLNFIPTDVLNSLPVDQRPAYFTARVPNPMAGLLPSSSFNNATIPRQQLLVAFPQFSQVTVTDVPIGSQRYDSMEARVTRRFERGLALQFAYTISKNLERVSVLNARDIRLGDLVNTPLEKRLVQFDTPRKLALVVSYEIPLGRNKRFGAGMNKYWNAIVGGWNLNTETVKQGGFPINFPNAAPLAARSAEFSDDQRDKLAQQNGRAMFDPSYDKYFDVTLFPSKVQAPYTLRTFPTRFPDVRGKAPLFNEISLFKEFVIKDRIHWEIRTDWHNAFNYPYFGRFQSVDVRNSQFGQLNADISNEQRIVVLVMKVVF